MTSSPTFKAALLSEVEKMPLEHKTTLNFVIELLAEVSKLSDINKMTVDNLSAIFAPTLMRPLVEKKDMPVVLREIRVSQCIVNILISNKVAETTPLDLSSRFSNEILNRHNRKNRHNTL